MIYCSGALFFNIARTVFAAAGGGRKAPTKRGSTASLAISCCSSLTANNYEKNQINQKGRAPRTIVRGEPLWVGERGRLPLQSPGDTNEDASQDHEGQLVGDLCEHADILETDAHECIDCGSGDRNEQNDAEECECPLHRVTSFKVQIPTALYRRSQRVFGIPMTQI